MATIFILKFCKRKKICCKFYNSSICLSACLIFIINLSSVTGIYHFYYNCLVINRVYYAYITNTQTI